MRGGIVDVLEMHVGDALGSLTRQVDRIGAADQRVAGVQAQWDGRAVEHSQDLVALLDHRSDVRVDNCPDSTLGRGVGGGDRDCVAGFSNSCSSSSGRESSPSEPVPRPDTKTSARAATKTVEDARRVGHRIIVGFVQQYGSKSADCAQLVTREHLGRLSAGAVGRKPVGSDFGCGRPTSRISGEDLRGSSWYPQPGTSHTPHEIGAPAMRGVLMSVPHSRREGTGSSDFGIGDGADPRATVRGSLGDPRRLRPPLWAGTVIPDARRDVEECVEFCTVGVGEAVHEELVRLLEGNSFAGRGSVLASGPSRRRRSRSCRYLQSAVVAAAVVAGVRHHRHGAVVESEQCWAVSTSSASAISRSPWFVPVAYT